MVAGAGFEPTIFGGSVSFFVVRGNTDNTYVELQLCCFDHHEQSQLSRPFLIGATGVAGDALGEGVEVHAGRAVSLVRLRVVPEVRRAQLGQHAPVAPLGAERRSSHAT